MVCVGDKVDFYMFTLISRDAKRSSNKLNVETSRQDLPVRSQLSKYGKTVVSPCLSEAATFQNISVNAHTGAFCTDSGGGPPQT